MADTKISALTGATTPLAGTEVLPIVQGGVTVKVATNDLTVRNVRANATTGILQVAGPANATTRVMTTPNANFTAARTDAAQSLTGDQTLATGNLVLGTSGKGIDFSATSSGSGTMNSELLADYEEGAWTPILAFGGLSTGITYQAYNKAGFYYKIGNIVFFSCTQYLSSKGSATGAATVGGLPFTSAQGNGGRVPLSIVLGGVTYVGQYSAQTDFDSTQMVLNQVNESGVTSNLDNTNFANTSTFFISGFYTTVAQD